MRKTPGQLSWCILVKCAAGEEGNPAMWRKMVNRVAKARGFPPPTDAEFEEMFPKGWGKATDNLEDAYQNSSWFKKNTQKAGASSYQPSSSSPPPSSSTYHPPTDDLDAIARSAGTLQRSLRTQGAKILGLSAIPLATGALSAAFDSPEERYFDLGISGAIGGFGAGTGIGSLRDARGWGKIHDAAKANNFAEVSSRYSKMPKNYSPGAGIVGGLAGLGLGLGGAALWNKATEKPKMKKAAGIQVMRKTAHQLATDVLRKTAAISDQEIASGLAGKTLRTIPDEDVQALISSYGDKAYAKHKNAPLWGGGVGGLLGGVGGAIAGIAAPGGSGKASLIGGLAGAGLGGGLGALLGRAQRSGAVTHSRNLGSSVGGIAQTGHIPYDLPGDIRTDDLLSYAKGIQGTPEPISFQDEQAVRDRLANRLMLVRGAEGAIRGGLTGALANRDREDASGDAVLNAAIHGGVGTLRGRAEAREMARKVLDLKSRGYGTLADRYYNDALDPSVFGY